MSALVMPFSELLADLEDRVGLDSASDTAGNKRKLARFLSNASRTAWNMPRGKRWVWPFTTNTATLTLGGSGQIALSDVDWGVWVSLWNTDPRPVGSGGRTAAAYSIPWTADAAGIWPTIAPSGIFAFYIKRAPEYTSTAAALNTAYAADAIVFDTGRTGSTGECYRCVAAYTSSNDNSAFNTELATPAKWVVQPVYKDFQSAMAQYAHATWLRSLNDHETAGAMEAEGRDDLESLFCGIYPNSPTASAPPWITTGAWR